MLKLVLKDNATKKADEAAAAGKAWVTSLLSDWLQLPRFLFAFVFIHVSL
jgi:hypothetical protein